MFASTELAVRIDGAEGRLCADIVHASVEHSSGTRSLVTPLAGGLVIYAGPGSPMNKGIGIALTEPLEETPLADVEQQWRDRNEPMRIELSALAKPDAATLLTARGYRLIGFENQLGCDLHAADAGLRATGSGLQATDSGLRATGSGLQATDSGLQATDSGLRATDFGLRASGDGGSIVVDRLADADERLWRDVTVDSFAQPDGSAAPHEIFPREVLDGIFTTLGRTGGFRRYVARVDGEVAGAGSMRIDGDIAQLAGAATLPAFRRRGVQTALLEHRLQDARNAGCALAVVTTQPGSTSQANVQRRGFALLYTRAILVRSW